MPIADILVENKRLHEKLDIYESRLCIIDGVIHSLLADKIYKSPVAIGFLESAYHYCKSDEWRKDIRIFRKVIKKVGKL